MKAESITIRFQSNANELFTGHDISNVLKSACVCRKIRLKSEIVKITKSTLSVPTSVPIIKNKIQ